MVKKRLKIGVLFGGKSAEHEVSLTSARNVLKGLDTKKYEVVPIKIPKNGKFSFEKLKKVDLIFPVLHGPFGEDGSMQGLFKLLEKPFVGAGVLGSAVGMDKEVMKRLLKEAGIPIGKYLTFRAGEKISFSLIARKLKFPVYVKPANMGSSVGINKAKNEKELKEAIKEAFLYDSKIVIEAEIKGREIECAVLGNEKLEASLPGEIVPTKNFYSYEAKYVDDSAILVAPTKLPQKTIKEIQTLAKGVFQILSCEGMGRVDFFLTPQGKLVVNEINTIPGFTAISMYPKLWGVSGKPLPKLLDRLIELSLERFQKEKKLKTII